MVAPSYQYRCLWNCAHAQKRSFSCTSKTARQSVHRMLRSLYGPDKVAPVRVNRHWKKCTHDSLGAFDVFSGHLDWDRLDFVPAPKIVFALLRDLLERIASFYLFMKKNASAMSAEELERPSKRGQRLIASLSIDDYFCDTSLTWRSAALSMAFMTISIRPIWPSGAAKAFWRHTGGATGPVGPGAGKCPWPGPCWPGGKYGGFFSTVQRASGSTGRFHQTACQCEQGYRAHWFPL